MSTKISVRIVECAEDRRKQEYECRITRGSGIENIGSPDTNRRKLVFEIPRV